VFTKCTATIHERRVIIKFNNGFDQRSQSAMRRSTNRSDSLPRRNIPRIALNLSFLSRSFYPNLRRTKISSDDTCWRHFWEIIVSYIERVSIALWLRHWHQDGGMCVGTPAMRAKARGGNRGFGAKWELQTCGICCLIVKLSDEFWETQSVSDWLLNETCPRAPWAWSIFRPCCGPRA
jgi:hypothetical protein